MKKKHFVKIVSIMIMLLCCNFVIGQIYECSEPWDGTVDACETPGYDVLELEYNIIDIQGDCTHDSKECTSSENPYEDCNQTVHNCYNYQYTVTPGHWFSEPPEDTPEKIWFVELTVTRDCPGDFTWASDYEGVG